MNLCSIMLKFVHYLICRHAQRSSAERYKYRELSFASISQGKPKWSVNHVALRIGFICYNLFLCLIILAFKVFFLKLYFYVSYCDVGIYS